MAKSPLPPEAQGLRAEGSGRVLVASSQEDELSFAGKPYSAFTLALIEALCGTGVAKEDGIVRVADLALHAREVVPGRTDGRQHPILHFEHADNFALAYYAGGEKQSKGLPFTVAPEIEPEPGAWAGPVLSGRFEGPVAVGGGEAVDMRGAQHVVYKPAGPVEQQFGHRLVISGSQVSGQVAVGDGNTQIQTIGTPRLEVTEAELAELRQALADLKAQVAAQVPPEQRDAALERVDELASAITAEEPDLTTMEYVKGWFASHLPGLAGAVAGVVVHPVVGRLVEVAGDALAAEFRRRFGGAG
jgi:hypothetical protein